jgi:hypothetical protein
VFGLCVQDVALKQQLIAHVVVQIDTYPDLLLEHGVKPEHVRRMQNLAARDLTRIAQMRSLDLQIGFCSASILACLDTIEAERSGVPAAG